MPSPNRTKRCPSEGRRGNTIWQNWQDWPSLNRWMERLGWQRRDTLPQGPAQYHNDTPLSLSAAVEPSGRTSSNCVIVTGISEDLLERAHAALDAWSTLYKAVQPRSSQVDGYQHARRDTSQMAGISPPNDARLPTASRPPFIPLRRTRSLSSPEHTAQERGSPAHIVRHIYGQEIHDLVRCAQEMAQILAEITPDRDHQVLVPPSAPQRGFVSSPLMTKANAFLSGDEAFEKLPLLERYHEVCRLIRLLDEEFDDASREYLDALIAKDAEETKAMLESDSTTLQGEDSTPVAQTPAEHVQAVQNIDLRDLQDLLSPGVFECPVDNIDLEGLLEGRDSSQALLLEAGDTHQSTQARTDVDTQRANQHNPHERSPDIMSVITGMSSPVMVQHSSDLQDDDVSVYDEISPAEIVDRYPSMTAEYEHQLGALDDLRLRLEEQCQKEGLEIGRYRDATDVPLAKDSFLWDEEEPDNVAELTTVHDRDLFADFAFDTLPEDIAGTLPAGIDVAHISRDRQQNVSPPPSERDKIESSVVQWAEEATLSTANLDDQERDQVSATSAESPDQDQALTSPTNIQHQNQVFPTSADIEKQQPVVSTTADLPDTREQEQTLANIDDVENKDQMVLDEDGCDERTREH